jgi:SAM-dependent methyltransferase
MANDPIPPAPAPPAPAPAPRPDAALIDYYARRAPELEKVYDRPERHAELLALAALLRRLVTGRDVLEIACGTGYWTERVAPATRSWLATDLAEPMLDLARAKRCPGASVRFALADAFSLGGLPGRFTAALAGFLWSHVPRHRLPALIAGLAARLEPGARVVFFDNRELPGHSLPSYRRDAAGNSYQLRRLSDGSEHEVLKNYPTPADLLAAAPPGATAPAVIELDHYWTFTYLTGQR